METNMDICTIISKNYLAKARTLAKSFAKHNKGRVFVLLADKIDGYFDPAKEDFTLIKAEDLAENIPCFDQFCFSYNITEFNTALKPFFLEFLFRKYHMEKLIFLDPDILVCNSLDELSKLLDTHSIILTPHITRPFQDDLKPDEIEILKHGLYNLGFIALANTKTGKEFLSWWRSRLTDHCTIDYKKGLYVDQKWIDLAPCLFDGILILKDPTYNIAQWNLHYRKDLVIEDGIVLLDNRRVNFIHFSGFDPEKMVITSGFKHRFSMNELDKAKAIYDSYRDELNKNGHKEIKGWPYHWGHYDNGSNIPDQARILYRNLSDEQKKGFGDPFRTGGGSYYLWLAKGHHDPIDKEERLEFILNSRVYRWGLKVKHLINVVAPTGSMTRKILSFLPKAIFNIFSFINGIGAAISKIDKERMDRKLLGSKILYDEPQWHGNISGWEEHIPFAFLLTKILKPKVFVELGVQYGISYFAFCQAVKKKGYRTKCFGIDSWKGDGHTKDYDESVYADVSFHNAKNYRRYSSLLKCYFDDALTKFKDKSIDLLHIDGFHTYGSVKHDFETWLPKMSNRGIILFHDTTVKRDDFGVWKLWDEIEHLYPSYNFEHNYGLGILAVGKKADKRVIHLINKLKKDPSYAKMFAELGATILRKGSKS